MRRQERDWSRLVDEHSASGTSVKDFCKSRGINSTSFYKNRKIIKRQPMVEIPVSGSIELTPIVVKSGCYSVCIHPGFDRDSLKSILEVIGKTE